MAHSAMDARHERGQLIDLQDAPTSRSRAAHRRGRSHSEAFAPAWKARAHASEPAELHSATDGALALLDRAQPAAAPATHPVAAGRHILIVEDDPRVAHLIRDTLALEGEATWDVQVASEGVAALALAGATPPDVVLLDVLLPGLDGAEVYRRLRANPDTRAARVLFLTAGTTLDLAQRGVEDGVLLRKPFDVRDLVSLVRALLQG